MKNRRNKLFKTILFFSMLFVLSGCTGNQSTLNTTTSNIISTATMEFSITYVLNGGTNSVSNPETYISGSELNFLDPSFEENEFEGWYLEEDFSTEIESIYANTFRNLTLYAKWKWVFISTATELQAITENQYLNYKLLNDINLAEVTWEPIADFYGIFDGNYYVISNLSIIDSEATTTGLFASNHGVIQHITLDNLQFVLGFIQNGHVGGLVGVNYGDLIQCGAYGSITFYGDLEHSIGGLVGANRFYHESNKIEECFSFVNIEVIGSPDAVGGLIGFSLTTGLEISNSYSFGNITVEGGQDSVIYIGGLIGYIWGGLIHDSYSANIIVASGNSLIVGGLVGWNRESTVLKSFGSGSLTANISSELTLYGGGLIGLNNGIVSSSYRNLKQTLDFTNSLGEVVLSLVGSEVGPSSFGNETFLTASLGLSADTWEFVNFFYPTLKWETISHFD